MCVCVCVCVCADSHCYPKIPNSAVFWLWTHFLSLARVRGPSHARAFSLALSRCCSLSLVQSERFGIGRLDDGSNDHIIENDLVSGVAASLYVPEV